MQGTIRDSLHMIDVWFSQDGGPLLEIVVTDADSDQKGWRISKSADYGPLGTFARGRVDTAKIRRNWEDILRILASV